MNILRAIGDIILSSWIWQFTSDWFHPVLTGVVMFFIIRITMRRSRTRAFLTSVLAQIVSLALLSFIALGILVHLFGWEFEMLDPQEGVKQIAFFMPSLQLGILYAIFSSCMFIFLSFFWRINLVGYIVISWLSNGIGAILSYMFVRMAEILKYTG